MSRSRMAGGGEIEVQGLEICSLVKGSAYRACPGPEYGFRLIASFAEIVVFNSTAYSTHPSLPPASAAKPGVLEQQRQAEFLSFKPCSDLTSQANLHLSHLTPQSSWHSIGPSERHQSPRYQHWNQPSRTSPSQAPMAHQVLDSLALAGDTPRINLKAEQTVRRMVRESD